MMRDESKTGGGGGCKGAHQRWETRVKRLRRRRCGAGRNAEEILRKRGRQEEERCECHRRSEREGGGRRGKVHVTGREG